MIETESPATGSNVKPSIPTGGPEVPSTGKTTGVEYFLRVVIIALGIFLGYIAAFIIGLMAGWIPFNC